MKIATGVRTKNSTQKAILVPIDFSMASHRALKHALVLAGDRSRLIALHVVPQEMNSDVDLAESLKTARHRFQGLCETSGISARERIRLDVRRGAPFREILDHANENAVEMIVLGLDDYSPLGGVALGHTADRVSRYARCPVLLVRGGNGTQLVRKDDTTTPAQPVRDFSYRQ